MDHVAAKPGKLHVDKAYDHVELRAWVRDRGIVVRIARKGVETSNYCAFLTLAATLTCYKKLAK